MDKLKPNLELENAVDSCITMLLQFPNRYNHQASGLLLFFDKILHLTLEDVALNCLEIQTAQTIKCWRSRYQSVSTLCPVESRVNYLVTRRNDLVSKTGNHLQIPDWGSRFSEQL